MTGSGVRRSRDDRHLSLPPNRAGRDVGGGEGLIAGRGQRHAGEGVYAVVAADEGVVGRQDGRAVRTGEVHRAQVAGVTVLLLESRTVTVMLNELPAVLPLGAVMLKCVAVVVRGVSGCPPGR